MLDTYEAERRKVDADNIETAVRAAQNLQNMSQALGVSPEKSVDENWAALRLFWEDLPGSEERRHAFSTYLGQRTLEYRQHNTDFGFTYDSTAIVADGSPAPELLDKVRLYEPSTRPGSQLPHAWVLRAGERLALRSLIHDGHFVLIAGEDGHDWVEAARKLSAETGIPLRAATVGVDNGDLIDFRLAWLKNREIAADGAVLVRPDGFIAFRTFQRTEDPRATLASALAQILSTPIHEHAGENYATR